MDLTDAVVSRTLEYELRLLQEAISLVAGGHAPRVIVGGLRLGDQVLEPARLMGIQAGVRIVPLWNADEAGLDIEVDRDTNGDD